MTLASSIITDAYRESNLIAKVGTPDTTETAEALRRLNSILLSVVGNEAGDEMRDLIIGGALDQSSSASPYLPENCRLVLNLSAAAEFDLPAYPYEGQRLALVDAGANLATYNVTLNGNGRRIEGAASLTLSTNGIDRQWLYRGDTANWVRITALVANDTMPFPQDFDDFFITALAMRLNPRHTASLDQQSLAAFDRQRTQLRARYRKPKPSGDPGIRGLMGQSASGGAGGQTAFNAG